ncbi:MAG: dihydroxy-acid dehydratase, partial [Deltaproteobacteria bacterium]|nr:dihydroxy-acid dehydratase [Deltaproteobacteria bacterium]
PIALIAEGDTIRIDIPARKLELAVDPQVLEERKKSWKLPESMTIAKGSLLERYRRMVGSAMKGSILE